MWGRSIALGCALVIVATGPAFAGEPPAKEPAAETAPSSPPPKPMPWAKGVSAEDRAEAEAIFAKGNVHYGDKDYAKALEQYRAAVKIWDHPSIRFNMTVALIDLESWVDAWHSLARSLRFGKGPLSDKTFADAKRYDRLLKGLVAVVKVASKPAGAALELDGKPIAAGADQVITVGDHVIVAKKAGFVTTTQKLQARGGAPQAVEVLLLPQTRTRKVYPMADWVPWVTIGAGVVVAAAGLPLWFTAKADLETYDGLVSNACGGGCHLDSLPADVADAKTKWESEYGGSLALFALGGAAVVTGALLFILNQPKLVEEAISVDAEEPAAALSVSPTLGGASFSLTF